MVKKQRLEPKPWSLTSSACLSQKSWVGNSRGSPVQLEEASARLRSPEGVGPAPSSPPLRRRSAPVCLHLVYSCVQSYLGARSAPRAGLCIFITTQLCVDSPTYRSHLHHLTRPRGAWGLLPDLTSGAGPPWEPRSPSQRHAAHLPQPAPASLPGTWGAGPSW